MSIRKTKKRAKRGMKNSFWGLFLIVIAVILILSQLGYLGEFSVWTLILAVASVSIMIDGIIKFSFPSILFPIALLIILFDKTLCLTAITPWPVLGAALLLSVGLSMIFQRKHMHVNINTNFGENDGHKKYFKMKRGPLNNEDDIINDENEYPYEDIEKGSVSAHVRLGGIVKYVDLKNFKYADLTCDYGNLEVYFNQAQLDGDTARIHLQGKCGNVELYVPYDWTIVNNLECTLGNVEIPNNHNTDQNKRVYLEGEYSLGNVEVIRKA